MTEQQMCGEVGYKGRCGCLKLLVLGSSIRSDELLILVQKILATFCDNPQRSTEFNIKLMIYSSLPN
jgi:hypothetical protein